MVVDKIGKGEVVCRIPVTKGVQNAYSTLHGGAISTLVDVVGTMAILTEKPTTPGVSVELSVSFARAAKADEEVIVKGRVLKMGRSLAFTEVELLRADTLQLIAKGKHTKAL